MAFRRSDDTSPGSQRWRLRHRTELLRYGIPESIVESDNALTHLLLHGYDAFGSGWEPASLSASEALALLAFLREQFTSDASAYDLVRILERQCSGAAET